jgi:GNAT superfamily N-acetyltransferase
MHMPASAIYEIIGYIASLLVAILKLRIIKLIGALFFTIYGLVIRAYPVAVMNFFVVVIDLYYLYQMISAREFFRLLPVRADSEYLQAFLNFYTKDIQRFLPGFTYTPADNQVILFVLRNLIPAGLVIGEIRDGDSLYVRLDYAIPGYRDLKIGRFVFEQNAAYLRERKIRKIYTRAGAPAHAQYLKQMGFVPEEGSGEQMLYCLTLD